MHKNSLRTVIMGCTFPVIFNHLLNVILGFIPRIHSKHFLSRHYRACPDNLDPRVKPEDDNRKRMCFKTENDNLVAQCGRSMIEMLGVLAVVGVLSVGGIAGYSKAMRMYKSNIQKRMISSMVANMINIRDKLDSKSQELENITYIFEAMSDIPEGLTYKNNYLYDTEGNEIYINYGVGVWNNQDGSQGKQFVYGFRFNYISSASIILPSAEDFCLNALQVIKEHYMKDFYSFKVEYSDSLSWDKRKQDVLYNKNALSSANLTDIYKKCKITFNEKGSVRFSLMLNPY